MEDGSRREISREVSIVALGQFNPAIFQPQWFAATGLLRQEEADKAEVGVIHSEMTTFVTEWFKLDVTAQRFAVFTRDASKHHLLRDLAVGTFQILEHSPIKAVGFNSVHHFAMESEDIWHRFGHHYAPKESWGNILEKAGLRVMVMEGKRAGGKADYIWVRFEPSVVTRPGIHFSINEHFDFKGIELPQDRLTRFKDMLSSEWESFQKYAEDTCKELLDQADPGPKS